ncbi:odorant receptor 4-like [Amyelois transitella]|uniref:odorant receptor 4-like n=1 Tax=Amyelois transitella TaxID=680683 RepID=UPI00298FD9D5|nr:odorant receptor 4-like [Amyelois transitella]
MAALFMRVPQVVAHIYVFLPFAQTLVLNYILGEDDELRLPFRLLGVSYAFLGVDYLFIILCAHLSTEFKMLTKDLILIKPTKMADYGATCIVYDNRPIRNFVKMHQVYIRLASDMNDATNNIMFVNLLCATITLSFFGLAVLATSNMMDKLVNLVVVVTVMLLTLIQCYYCEKLKTASEEIFCAACENPWYEGNLEYQNIIHLIMVRSQKPCYIKSLHSPITLRTFTKVMSTTWSYFSLMNTVYQNNE